MRPAARVQAAIELLDQIIEAAQTSGAAADTLIARYFKTRRFAGSGDRRAIRELVYRAIRRSGERPTSGRAALLGLAEDDSILLQLFGGEGHAAGALIAGEPIAAASAAPLWLKDRFDPLAAGEDEQAALLDRAPLDIRVNTLRGTLAQARAAFPEAEPSPLSPTGLRLADGYAVEESAAWQAGLVEIQDEGSQLIALATGAAPGMRVVDLCAGAGGKALALAAMMDGKGGLHACDTDRGRLSRMVPRVRRAGAENIETHLLNPNRELETLGELIGQADIVLVDAPCSGTGTWRRNPEARWRLTPGRLDRLVKLQAHILDVAADLVRPGGVLVYAVCSLLTEEGRAQAEAFAARRSAFVSEDPPIPGGRPAGAGRLLSPRHDRTDGFFIARWRAPC